MTGYNHPEYAKSLSEFGIPRRLINCQGWLLVRSIAQSHYCDAMGPYPLFSCQNWAGLPLDLEELSGELVSVVLVTDPFGDYDLSFLESCFRDVVVPFKEHYVTDLHQSPEQFVSKHHRRNVGKGMKNVKVEIITNPGAFLMDWVSLYDVLIDRHEIAGIAAFSHASFAQQLDVPGIVAFRATAVEETVGMTLWYRHGATAYYHLGAYSQRGYELQASFALFWIAIEYFIATGLDYLNLGAGAGVKKSSKDGLSRFKRGWSNGTRTAYLCGRILDRAKYAELTKAKGVPEGGYFPAYRYGEFK